MVVAFWIMVVLAIGFLCGIIFGFITKNFILSSCLNIGLAVCAFVMNILNIFIS